MKLLIRTCLPPFLSAHPALTNPSGKKKEQKRCERRLSLCLAPASPPSLFSLRSAHTLQPFRPLEWALRFPAESDKSPDSQVRLWSLQALIRMPHIYPDGYLCSSNRPSAYVSKWHQADKGDGPRWPRYKKIIMGLCVCVPDGYRSRASWHDRPYYCWRVYSSFISQMHVNMHLHTPHILSNN